MDAASAALFEALARRARVLVVDRARDAAGRAGGLVAAGRWRTPGSSSGRCPPRMSATLALATPEAAQVPPHVVELAVERSGGSPEFLLDLLAAAAAGDRDELPESVGAATMARIDALDPRDGAVVRRAAVLGINFHPRRLADVLAADMRAARRRLLGPAVGRVRARAGRPRALQAPRDPGGRVREPAVQASARAAPGGRPAPRARRGSRARRRARRSSRITSRWPATTRGRTATRWRPPSAPPSVLARGRGAAVSAGDRGRAGGRWRGRIRSLAEAWEQLGEALRNVGEPAAAAQGADRGAAAAARRPDRAGAAVPPPRRGRRAQRQR